MTDAWFSPETARPFSSSATRRALTRGCAEAELRRTVAADL
jgi:hypothetical protein